MDFQKMEIVPSRNISSLNLHSSKQSYRFLYFFETNELPQKTALEYKLNNQITSIAFTNKEEFYKFIVDCVYSYIYTISKKTTPNVDRKTFILQFVRFIISDLEKTLLYKLLK